MKKQIIVISFLILILCAAAIPAAVRNIAYTYDHLERLTKIDYGGGVFIEYGYDDAGNIISVKSSAVRGLEHVIAILKLLSGMTGQDVSSVSDISGDQRIGIEETVDILRSVAGM